MNELAIQLVDATLENEIVTSYGADSDTRVSPRVVTAVFKLLETILMYPF